MAGKAEPITVLQVLPALETGGAERTAVDVALALSRAGGRSIVVSEGGRMVGELAEAGVRHVTLPAASKSPLTMYRNAARLAALAEAEGVHILHARSRAPAWSALVAARWTRRPLVTTYHGAYAQRSALKARYNSVMARGDVVIANSAYTAELIGTRHPFAQGRIVTIPRGTDVAAFGAPAADRRDAIRAAWGVGAQRVILHLARLTPWKGQAVVIDALSRLTAEDVVCVFAGDDQGRTDYTARLKADAARLGVAERARFVGHVSDVPGALAAADFAVVASTEPEAFGRAAVEASAAGVPVIVSDHGAVGQTVLAPPHVSPEERTGWRVPPGDADALAVALSKALGLSAAERRAIGERGHAHAGGFSLSAMTEKTLAVYRSLLEPGPFALYS